VLVRAWERREEERRKKGEGKKKMRKRKREKGKRGKRRKIKGDAGGIHGDDREPGVASTKSDAHEKRGK
jgi:hypothetical protein